MQVKSEYEFLIPVLQVQTLEDLHNELIDAEFMRTQKTYSMWRWVKHDLIFKAYPGLRGKICVQSYKDNGYESVKLFENFHVKGQTADLTKTKENAA